MQHHTHTSGDIAVTATILDLTKRGWAVFRPVSAEFLPFDLLAVKEVRGKRKVLTFQVKHSSSIQKRHPYAPGEFDYFALYLRDRGVVAYVALSLTKSFGVTETYHLSTTLPNSPNPFFWYKDFLVLSKKRRRKRSFRDFGYKLCHTLTPKRKKYLQSRKANPKFKISDRELSRAVWRQPMGKLSEEYNVSTTTIRKTCKARGIEYPDLGYWVRRERKK